MGELTEQFLTEQCLKAPFIEKRGEYDYLELRSKWQVGMLCESAFVERMIDYLESCELPFRVVVSLAGIESLSELELGCLYAVIGPMVEADAVICFCLMTEPVAMGVATIEFPQKVLVAVELEEAIRLVREAG